MKTKVIAVVSFLMVGSCAPKAASLEFEDCGRHYAPVLSSEVSACETERRTTRSPLGEMEVSPFGRIAGTFLARVEEPLAIERRSPGGWTDLGEVDPPEFRNLASGLYRSGGQEFFIEGEERSKKIQATIGEILLITGPPQKVARSLANYLCSNGYGYEGVMALRDYEDFAEAETKAQLAACYLLSPNPGDLRVAVALVGEALPFLGGEEAVDFMEDLSEALKKLERCFSPLAFCQ